MSLRKIISAGLVLCALECSAVSAWAQEGEIPVIRQGDVPKTADAAAARAASDRALAYLVKMQRPDGSWAHGSLTDITEYGFSVETYYAWKIAAHSLACMALMEAPVDGAKAEQRAEALVDGLNYLVTARRAKRGSDWDNDMVWSALYGFVASLQAADDERFDDELRAKLVTTSQAYLSDLVRNQAPDGGWGYYDDPPYSRRPIWATSFCTALVLPSLARAVELGWLEDSKVFDRASKYVKGCSLPNGAYEYDLNPVPRIRGGEHINNVKGSLGRIQVCNWALGTSGDRSITSDLVSEGVDEFLEYHKFLDVARMRPIPHEAYYANAGYFYFFGHFYASQAINLLPEEERVAYHERLRPHLIKTLRNSGSTSDFHGSDYMIVASTSFLSLSLEMGLK